MAQTSGLVRLGMASLDNEDLHLYMSLWTRGRLTHNLLLHCFPWQMEDLQGWKKEGVSAACIRPQMREGARVETGGKMCLQQQESSKRGFHQLLFLD